MGKNITGQLLIMNHPSNWIYRVTSNKDFLIQRCDDEFSEVVDNETEGWSVVTDPVVQSSIYKYMLQNELNPEYDYMDC